MNRYSIPLVGLSFLVGCTTAPIPAPTADSPANPSAPEATIRPLRNALCIDELTKKSRQILAQAAKQQQQWDQRGSDSGEHQGQQMQNMPGVQMPREQSQPSPSPNN